jgi:hypothetical protein
MPRWVDVAHCGGKPASGRGRGRGRGRGAGKPMLRFAAPVGADADFLQFASSASESVVDYWRGLLAELEERRGLTAYHLEVCHTCMHLSILGATSGLGPWRLSQALRSEGVGTPAWVMQVLPPHPTPRRARDATWCVTVVYDTAQSAQQRAGPIDATQCMSCDLVRSRTTCHFPWMSSWLWPQSAEGAPTHHRGSGRHGRRTVCCPWAWAPGRRSSPRATPPSPSMRTTARGWMPRRGPCSCSLPTATCVVWRSSGAARTLCSSHAAERLGSR